MRTEVIVADGWTIEVRGRTRRTAALESEYLLSLAQAHPDMKDVDTKSNGNAQTLKDKSPRGWSLAGVAATFRLFAARIHSADNGTEFFQEPFVGSQLVELFDNYLDCEQLPDKSDLWSRIEDAILRMDKAGVITDPNSEGSTQTK